MGTSTRFFRTGARHLNTFLFANALAWIILPSQGNANDFDVEVAYRQHCLSCHASGAAEAPIMGDKEAWATRIEQGMEVLVNNTIEGLNGKMPQRGLCFSCTDDQLKAIVEYMVEKSQ